MAIYRLEAKVIGRSSGRSATASAAYRAAERIEDERTGENFDYRAKGGVLHSEILAPDNAPDWMSDRAQLWNAVEQVEKRKDAQLARDLVLALPHELTHEQRVDLVRDFAREEFVAKGMVADIAIHAPDRGGDQRNDHAHVMLTMRELAGDGFGKKAREWNDPEQLAAWREHWANAVNRELERHGHEARVDHRSLADQGIEREPEPKQGPIATEMEREGRPSHAGDDRRAVQLRNAELVATEAQLSAVTAEIIDLEKEREARRPPPEAEALKVEPPQQTPEPARDTTTNPALTGGDSILCVGLDLFTIALYETIDIARDVGHEVDSIAGELARQRGPDKLTDFAAREVDRRAGENPPREVSASEYATSAEARREYQAQRAAAQERNAALSRLREDIEAGRHLDPAAVRSLSRDDLINIRDKGDDALRQMVADREREEKRQRDDYGRERER